MSHGESKVELSQAKLKHVCQVEQEGKRLSGSTLAWPPPLRLTSLTPSFQSQTCSDTSTISKTQTIALSFCLTPSPSSLLFTEPSSFVILCVAASLLKSESELFLLLSLPTVHLMSRVFMFNVTHLSHAAYNHVLLAFTFHLNCPLLPFVHTLFYNLLFSSRCPLMTLFVVWTSTSPLAVLSWWLVTLFTPRPGTAWLRSPPTSTMATVWPLWAQRVDA